MKALDEALRVLEETTERELVAALRSLSLTDLRNWIAVHEHTNNQTALALAKAEQTRRSHL